MDWSLLAILGTALALRLFTVLDWNHWMPDTAAQLRGDEPGYANTAREILTGKGYTWPGRVPLYPATLALLFWLTGESYLWVRILQCGLSIATVLATYVLGRKLFGQRSGQLAALAVALTFPLVRQPAMIMSEVLYTPMLLVIGILAVNAFQSPNIALRFALLGACVGISNLIRPTLLLFPIAVVIGLLATDRRVALRSSLSFTFAMLLTLLPWFVFTHMKFRAILPLQTSNAFLWQGSPEYFRLMRDRGYTYQRIWGEILYAQNSRTPDPTSVEGDRYWTRRALASIGSEPLTYLRFALEKTATYWIGDPSADWGNKSVFSYSGLRFDGYSPSSALKVLTSRLIPILTLGGIVLLWRKRRMLCPLYMILVFTTVFHAATHAEVRLSEPFYPFLLVILGGAADLVLHKWTEATPEPKNT